MSAKKHLKIISNKCHLVLFILLLSGELVKILILAFFLILNKKEKKGIAAGEAKTQFRTVPFPCIHASPISVKHCASEVSSQLKPAMRP